MIKEISEKLFAQFVAAVPVTPVSQPAPSVPLDLMQVAGASVYKRLLPAVGAAVVIAVVIYLLVR
jgi:hypothetical protein